MPDDPFETRRRGRHRVQVITAAVAAATAAGTGAVLVALASGDHATADATPVGSQDSGDGGLSSPSQDGGVRPPAAPPGRTSGGSGHASSGGS